MKQIVGILLIVILVLVICQKMTCARPRRHTHCAPPAYEYASDMPSHNDKGEYLNIITDVLTTDEDKQGHQDYVAQRELHGDQTRRLYQVPTPTNTRFIGRRPPSPVADPYSPQQLGITYNNSDGKWVKW